MLSSNIDVYNLSVYKVWGLASQLAEDTLRLVKAIGVLTDPHSSDLVKWMCQVTSTKPKLLPWVDNPLA